MGHNEKNTALPSFLQTCALVHFIFMIILAAPMLLIPVELVEMFEWSQESIILLRLASAGFLTVGVLSIQLKSLKKIQSCPVLITLATWNAVICMSFFLSMITTQDTITVTNVTFSVGNVIFLIVWLHFHGQFIDIKEEEDDYQL